MYIEGVLVNLDSTSHSCLLPWEPHWSQYPLCTVWEIFFFGNELQSNFSTEGLWKATLLSTTIITEWKWSLQ